jgi:hypothetical protein
MVTLPINRIITGNAGEWTHLDAGIGHGIDSFYEYLLKSYIFFDDEFYYSIFNEVKRIFLEFSYFKSLMLQ